MFNPKVKVGDRIVSIHMDGDNPSVPIGTKGTVMGSSETPFGKNIQVDWDNGSKLDLLDDVDVWMLEKDIKKKTITDSKPISEMFVENKPKNRVNQKFLIDTPLVAKRLKNSDDVESIKEDLKRMVLQNIIK
jgi:hypothetical protein